MKAIPLAFAFLISASPVFADDLELPAQQQSPTQTGISASELARNGDFRWTMLDQHGDPRQEMPAPPPNEALTRSLIFSADTPTETIEAQLRAVAVQIVDEAQRAGNVESLRVRLRVRCVKEDLVVKPDPLAPSSTPWIWTSLADDIREVRLSVESCSVSMLQSVQLRDEAPHMKPYSVLLSPIEDSAR